MFQCLYDLTDLNTWSRFYTNIIAYCQQNRYVRFAVHTGLLTLIHFLISQKVTTGRRVRLNEVVKYVISHKNGTVAGSEKEAVCKFKNTLLILNMHMPEKYLLHNL